MKKNKNPLETKIRIKLIEHNYKLDELATILHMSQSTIYNRLKAPDTFTLKELRALRHTLKFSTDEFLQAI